MIIPDLSESADRRLLLTKPSPQGEALKAVNSGGYCEQRGRRFIIMKTIKLIVTIIAIILLCTLVLRDIGVGFFSGLGSWVVYLLILFVIILGILNIITSKNNINKLSIVFGSSAFILLILNKFILDAATASSIWILIIALLIALITTYIIAWSKKGSPEKKE